MKNKIQIALTIAALLVLLVTSTVSAQYSGYNWSTVYQVVNIGTGPADITIDYFDGSGNRVTAAQKVFSAVPIGASRLVVQFKDDPSLPAGRYSAVISSNQPVAATVNQQLVAASSTSYNPVPPFSSYSGQDQGATTVTLPAVMYNWYNYYTEIYVMNVGAATATNTKITYVPSTLGGQTTGATGKSDSIASLAQYATNLTSQQSESVLGAPSGTYAGRFLGSAVVTSDQPVIAIVNQHNVHDFKLMSYNGFTSAGSTNVVVPVIMKNYYGYYTTLQVMNPSTTATANVTLAYTPSGPANAANAGSSVAPFSVNLTVAPQTALTRYDGPTGTTADQSDLVTAPHSFSRYYGSVKVTSDIPVVVQVNEEAVATGDDQAGSYNGVDVASATTGIVVPVVMADYYGYYTTMVVQNTTGTDGTCSISYTSDDTYSAVKNHTAAYSHALPANGAFTVYEGRKGGQEIGDVNHDTQWRSGGQKQFLGAATITCTVAAIAIENEEADIAMKDSMYTLNAFNK